MTTFADLMETSLSKIRPLEWEPYYATMAPWLRDDEAETRGRSVERLTMAVFWAEPSSHIRREWFPVGGQGKAFDPNPRLLWFLSEIETAHAIHDDIIPAFLQDLRFKHNVETRDAMLSWLQRVLEEGRPNVRRDVVQGTMVLLDVCDEDDPISVARFVGLLDDPSTYVRACAARQLSGLDGAALHPGQMFALIKAKDIERPGVAGPYWSEWSMAMPDLPVDPLIWMMDILEQRSGPEPADLPFNGIDFHLHELCDHSPETVARMIAGGHVELAVETATEARYCVDAMRPVLLQLADHPEPAIHRRAQRHLASYHRTLHTGARGWITRRQIAVSASGDAIAVADVFIFNGANGSPSYLVIYPTDDHAAFDYETAWRLIDRAIPPGDRGPLARHYLDFDRSAGPALHALGNRLSCRFANFSGAELECRHLARNGPITEAELAELSGDLAVTRIEVNAGRLAAPGNTWDPFAN